MAGVLSGTYQERDPRNLLVSFDLLKHLLTKYFNASQTIFDNPSVEEQFIEDFYDSISCYWPINFVPPKNDTIGVQPDHLKSLLNDCFLASPKLSDHFASFLIDKMTAKQVETKREAILLLTKILEKHPVSER